jgi:hypothetical protein
MGLSEMIPAERATGTSYALICGFFEGPFPATVWARWAACLPSHAGDTHLWKLREICAAPSLPGLNAHNGLA